MSSNGIKILSNTTRWHFDGTLKTCPAHFYQILSIHGYYQNQMFPADYILLQYKERETYIDALTQVKCILASNNLAIKIQEVLSDFELAIFQAISVVFENAKIYGCWFHFNQALIRFCAFRTHRKRMDTHTRQHQNNSGSRHYQICKIELDPVRIHSYLVSNKQKIKEEYNLENFIIPNLVKIGNFKAAYKREIGNNTKIKQVIDFLKAHIFNYNLKDEIFFFGLKLENDDEPVVGTGTDDNHCHILLTTKKMLKFLDDNIDNFP
ncbi:unnamed protein product [Brachionus calyciflorus]|uniref:MULE transposase domain-containing protein n=1 Tax=Brachionus calyciflorus TaxID=104777 RepID=A0A814ECS7_9BILA|nr:unnamed protein product [Brachionus calyciflorus]